MKEKLEKLQEVIGYRFKDPGLLTHALTHSSYANENTGIRRAAMSAWNFWAMPCSR